MRRIVGQTAHGSRTRPGSLCQVTTEHSRSSHSPLPLPLRLFTPHKPFLVFFSLKVWPHFAKKRGKEKKRGSLGDIAEPLSVQIQEGNIETNIFLIRNQSKLSLLCFSWLKPPRRSDCKFQSCSSSATIAPFLSLFCL